MDVAIRYLKRIVPDKLKLRYAGLKQYAANRPRRKEIDLRRTLVGGEGPYDAVKWAEMTGDWRRVSTFLEDSVYVQFLERYRVVGERIFKPEYFEHTRYFENAMKCVQFWGDYFGQDSVKGVLRQARSFVELYERIKNGDPREVCFPSQKDHAGRRTPAVVRETSTPGTFQITDGHHRLAILWMLGKRKAWVTVLRPPAPSALQALVLRVSQTQGRKELYQPIEGPEFDHSWGLVRRCHDRLAMMLEFLCAQGHDLKKLSVVDLACSYGWFVNEFSKKGAAALGVEADPTALQIGRIAYSVPDEHLVESDFRTFANCCGRTFDVVLLLSVLHYYPLRRAKGTPEEVLKEIDKITGSVLFFDTGQSHEEWWRDALPEWDDDFIIKFISQNTSFTKVVPLGRDADNVGCYSNNYQRTFFACIRS